MDRCRGGTTARLITICKLGFYSSLKGVSRAGQSRGRREGSARVSRGVWRCKGIPGSRAVCSRRPLGQPVVRGSVLAVGWGGMGRTSGVAGVLRRGTRGALAVTLTPVTLVTVITAARVPVMVGSAVIPLTAGVIPLSLESTPVTLENLRTVKEKKKKISQPLKMIYTPIHTLRECFMVWASDKAHSYSYVSNWPAWLAEDGFRCRCFGTGGEEGFPTALGWWQRRKWSYSGSDLSSRSVGGKLWRIWDQLKH